MKYNCCIVLSGTLLTWLALCSDGKVHEIRALKFELCVAQVHECLFNKGKYRATALWVLDVEDPEASKNCCKSPLKRCGTAHRSFINVDHVVGLLKTRSEWHGALQKCAMKLVRYYPKA